MRAERTCKRWVSLVYRAVQWLTADHWLANLKSRLQWWSYSFMDDHCWCEHCEKRRAVGLQGPLKGDRP